MPNSKLSISLEREKKFAKKVAKKIWWRCRELNPGPNNKEDSFLQV